MTLTASVIHVIFLQVGNDHARTAFKPNKHPALCVSESISFSPLIEFGQVHADEYKAQSVFVVLSCH